MSSILKALKKLEDEKVVRKPDSLKIDAEILRGDSASPYSAVKILVFATALFSCGGGAMYAMMKAGHTSQTSTDSNPVITKVASSSAPAAIPVERINVDPVVPASPSAPSPSRKRTPVSAATPAAKTVVHKPAVQPVEKSSPRTKSPTPIAIKENPPSKVIPSAAPLRQATPAPALKVTGIAFQDGIDSVAMINGIPVSKGSVIEGARVEAIHRDRVQFSAGSERFEIQLGKSNR